MVKLKDVAEMAGVAVSTASAVINGRECGIRVGAAARARILEAVRATGYVANSAARGLRTGKTSLIGVFPGSMLSSYVSEAMQGVENVLMRNNYSMILGSYGNASEFERKLEFMQEKNVEGLIILPGRREPEVQELYRRAASMRPTVFMAGNMSPEGTIFVRADSAELARMGTAYLIEHGHRRIALLLGVCVERLDGYKKALADGGITFDPSLVIEGGQIFEDGVAALPRLLELKADAVLTQGDVVAAGVVAAAWRGGVSIPGQLSVMGVDDMPVAHMITPALTTVAQPRMEQGELAADLLLRLISGESNVEPVFLTPKIIERESCRL